MRILSKDEMYSADKYTINELGVPEEILMENAGQVMFGFLTSMINLNDKIVVLAGGGNNGGDGIVIARRLKNLGFDARLVLLKDPKDYTGSSQFHLYLYQKHGYEVVDSSNAINQIKEATLIVDAIFGIGFHGEVLSPLDKVMNAVNSSPATVFSVDIPSGVCANGEVASCAIRANVTMTVQYPKLSTYLFPAASYFGHCKVAEIGIMLKQENNLPIRQTWNFDEFSSSLTKKSSNAHKGGCGRALIIGGCDDMIGAPILCTKSCFVSGIGLLKLAMPKQARSASAASITEATYVTCDEEGGVLKSVPIPSDIDVVACGPGLSRDENVENVVLQALSSNYPLVLDADALYFLDEDKLEALKFRTAPTILTPHAGEMARLCSCSCGYVNENRFSLAKEKAVKWGCILVLKGPFTIITFPDGNQFVNTSGNEGLAKGGSGDVLTGIITAFIASHGHIVPAVCNAVFAHGLAADLLLENGHTTRDITATDVIKTLPEVFNKAYNNKN